MTMLDVLKSRIAEQGPISVDDYMKACLYHPEHGYYMKNDPIGQHGDFITAPEITQMFGEVVGAWVADTWIKMGKPENWNLLELGPGRGTLMADMLRTLQSAIPEAYETAKVTLVEVSPSLKIIQRNALIDHPVCWATSVDDVDFTNPTILIGNEILDAFPTKQFVRTPAGYVERLIGIEENTLTFKQSENTVEVPAEANGVNIVEEQHAMESYLCKLKDKMTNGVALFIDYGDEGYGDSLQAVRGHKTCDILNTPGEADLTTHVNFSNVRKVLGADNTSEMEYMGTFLTSIGLAARAAQLLSTAESAEDRKSIESAAHRLLHPEQMGEMFKAIAYRTGSWELAGLTFMQQEDAETTKQPLEIAV